jgi:hypothetical protein
MEEDKALLEFIALSGKQSWMKIGFELGNLSDVESGHLLTEFLKARPARIQGRRR